MNMVVQMTTLLKLIAFELAGEDRDRRKNRVLSRLKIAFFRVAQTWLNGFFPSPREFCGQLKRNQLYNHGHDHT
jgi:hypothetical protein